MIADRYRKGVPGEGPSLRYLRRKTQKGRKTGVGQSLSDASLVRWQTYSVQCSALCRESVQLYGSVLYHGVTSDELVDRCLVKKARMHAALLALRNCPWGRASKSN